MSDVKVHAELSREERLRRADNMLRCGSHFTTALANAWFLADATNQAILEEGFAHYFEKYADPMYDVKP
jgi:hypothetical protein